ncbi:MAG TPA: 16S rRNA (guanine(527)-N(7))-methyltransferase RsmG [Candidatus Acidoferrales bacterium]|nr:16S rRNA (guanine(527)-N(7))-methyltransferase RsmG [Candidatus Acidoferrales bacterium]
MSELRALLEAGGVLPEHLDRLAHYGEAVLEANRSFNLTGAKSATEFAPHILDSLTIARFVSESLVDVGSGGGLPAIPLAIVTGVPVTMIETTLKKARFLAQMLAELELSGEVVAARAEVAGHDPRLRGHFMTGTARAVATAPAVAELLLPLIAVGGRAVLQRGTIDERERNALSDAAVMLGGAVEDEVAIDGERRVILVRKMAASATRFPRRTGIPEKRPLCL